MSQQRLWIAALMLLTYALLCAGIAWRWRQAQRQQQANLQALQSGSAHTLVAYASQTGTAEQLTLQTARELQLSGVSVQVHPLNTLSLATLAQFEQAWFIASTYGEGDAPDGASVFVDRVMHTARANSASLAKLKVGVLALGDRQYTQFCAFGLRLHQWLLAQGAQATFAPIEVHQSLPQDLQAWQDALGLSAWQQQAGPYTAWQLVARTHINPGSQGQAMHWLKLQPVQGNATWQAGDLLQLRPHAVHTLSRRDASETREYSIASIPSHELSSKASNTDEGALQLLVREANWQAIDGCLHSGLCSGQLAQAPLGSVWQARIKPNPSFHAAGNERRPMVLVGTGSGLAGLHAHVHARARQHAQPSQAQPDPAPTWLVYGERQRSHDAFFAPQWQRWLNDGLLSRLSLSYSREQGEADVPRYVQDALYHEAETLRDWVGRGAAIYLCGSLQGMASGVDAALRDILGESKVLDLISEGRLRRDVY